MVIFFAVSTQQQVLAGHGSAYEREAEVARRRPRTSRRRVGHWVSQRLTALAAGLIPPLYQAYCWLVFQTSTIEDTARPRLIEVVRRHGRFVGLLWHQEVFSVAYGWAPVRPHTLASTGNFGRVITAMLEACDFTVFRGGSSRGSARARHVLRDMIKHMKSNPDVLYGVTVDGSAGPVFRMKPGPLMIARACQAPVYVVRTSFSKRWEAPTWDRTVFPLPFGRIHIEAVGPYWIDPRCSSEDLERFHEHVEHELQELMWHSYRRRQDPPPEWVRAALPAGWGPRWHPQAPGTKWGPWDLQEETFPPWATFVDRSRPGPPPLPRPRPPAADSE